MMHSKRKLYFGKFQWEEDTKKFHLCWANVEGDFSGYYEVTGLDLHTAYHRALEKYFKDQADYATRKIKT